MEGNTDDLCHRQNRPTRRMSSLGRLVPVCLVLFLALTGNVRAGNVIAQSQNSIRNTVKAYITQGIKDEYPHHEIQVSRLDPRLKLAACEKPLEGFLPPGAQLIGNTTIGVRCGGKNPWKIYVPASVKAMREVVITSRPILRHSTITKQDIQLEERNITSGSNAYIFSPEHVVGKLAKRALPAATALSPNMLDKPLLIHRGQEVIILASGPGLEVRMAGTALMDGTEGQIIRAKNKVSKRTIEGQVVRTGVIKVNM